MQNVWASRYRVDDELFNGGPPLGWLKAIGLIRTATESRIAWRAFAAVLVSWLPLALLAAAQDFAQGAGPARSFFTDAAVHARFLIAVPLFIFAEADAVRWFGSIARHFLSAGFVEEHDRARFADAVASTRRMLDSPAAEFAAFLLTYAVAMILILNAQEGDAPAWYWATNGQFLGLSPAGWWHALVSLPLLLLLFWGWMWRLILWWRFLGLMARLDLRLVPAHPDRAGGLKFVSASLRGYRMLALAIAAIVAGVQLNLALRTPQPLFGFTNAAAAVLGFVLVLAVGPLVMFTTKLRATRLRGIFRYGPLACDVGIEFERKWVNRIGKLGPGTLEINDFSAMTDLYQVVENVYEAKDLPFVWNDVSHLIIITLLPFIPVALMAAPLKDILFAVMKLLL